MDTSEGDRAVSGNGLLGFDSGHFLAPALILAGRENGSINLEHAEVPYGATRTRLVAG